MKMNSWELAIHLNISKDCQRICSDFIFCYVFTADHGGYKIHTYELAIL